MSLNFEWDPKIGPATIVGIGGSFAVLISIGIAWGTLTTKLDTVIESNSESKKFATKLEKSSKDQDDKLAIQASQISAMQSTLNFIVPTIQRLEAALTPTPSPQPPPHR